MKRTVVILLCLLFAFAGCETFNKASTKEEPAKPRYDVVNQTFYGFPDVPVPKELKLDNNRSFIYETQALKVGVLVLSGNVELESLENYFKVNMAKNGWKFVNSFKFKDVALNFVKDDKTCNIRMSREVFTADVEIWIGPADRTGSPDRAGVPKSYESGK